MQEKIAIEIEVNGVTKNLKTVKDLKDAMKQLQETADKSDFGSEEYLKATAEAEKLKVKMNEINGTSQKVGNTIGELKKRFKELKVALSEAADPKEFTRLSKELNDVEGQLGDMNDAANLTTGSGVEQLNKSFSQLSEGIMNFDGGKIKGAFKGIGQAMNAIPILALVAGITALIQNWDDVVNFAKKVTGAFSDEEIAVQKATKAYETQKKVTSNLVREYERELKMLEATGASDKKIIEVKERKIQAQILEQKANLRLIDSQIRLIGQNDDLIEGATRLEIHIQKKLGNDVVADILEKKLFSDKVGRIKEEIDKKNEAQQAIKDLENDLVVLKEVSEKKITDIAKKSSEERKKQNEIDGEENYRKYKELQDRLAEEDNVVIEEKKVNAAQEIDIEGAKNAELLNQSALKYEEDVRLAKKAEELKAKNKLALEDATFTTSKALSDAFFAIQLGNAEKGSAKEKEIRKKQFQVEKAFTISKVIIDGIRSVQANLAIGPFGVPLAVLAGVTAAANVAKIAATQFDGGGGGSSAGGAVSAPSGGVSLPPPPTINTPQANTTFDAQGNNTGASAQRNAQPMKAYVVETEITTSQKNINRLTKQATY